MPTQQESFVKKLFKLRLFLVINILVLLFLGLSFGREYLRNYNIEREIHNLETQAANLETRNMDLVRLAQAYQTEEYLEAQARLKFGYRMPGESVVIIQQGEEMELSAAEAMAEEVSTINGVAPEEISNVQLWWWYFFHQDKFLEYKHNGING